MDKLRQSLRESFKKKKSLSEEETYTRITWPKDEAAVKNNTCSFEMKYLGCVEVFESRGMQVCEEALKLLKNSKKRPIRGTLHVSGDGLRVVDSDTKGLVLDQTIEKVSFCAPDRYYERGFSYICRDGTTRRWMCHGFLAIGDSGERLSHAVGCAFAICLEKKQQREKDCSVQFHYNQKDNTFIRFGSFQQGSIKDRLQDPQEFKPALPPPPPKGPEENPHAVARPKASDMFLRQASMRGMRQLPGNSLFKRQYSLRLEDLPSNLSRQQSGPFKPTFGDSNSSRRSQLCSLPSSLPKSCTPIQEDPGSPQDPFSPIQHSPFETNSGPLSLPPVLDDDIPPSLPPPLLSPALLPLSPPPVTSPPPHNPFTSMTQSFTAGSNQSSPRRLSREPSPRVYSPAFRASPTSSLNRVGREPLDDMSSLASSLVTSPEGSNPWDNVPDQPILRFGSVRVLRPVSMVESRTLNSSNSLGRGYLSLENSMDQKCCINQTMRPTQPSNQTIKPGQPTNLSPKPTRIASQSPKPTGISSQSPKPDRDQPSNHWPAVTRTAYSSPALTKPNLEPGVPPVETGAPPGEPGVPMRGPGVYTGEPGVYTGEPCVPTGEPGVPTGEPGVPKGEPGVPTGDSPTGILVDPFDSDWADVALNTLNDIDTFKNKCMSFELQM